MTEPMIPAEPTGTSATGSAGRWAILTGAALLAIVAAGAVAGFVMAGQERHPGALPLRDVAIIAALAALAIAAAAVAWRSGRRLLAGDAHIPPRERRARNILLASGALGGVLGLVFAITGLAGTGDDPLAIISDAPIPPLVAVGMSLVLVTLLPWLSWRWHAAIDEHERESYRDGAYVAAYAYLLGAPLWWLLWRGGILPAPDGIIIYLAFNLLFLGVWMWKKYR